MFWDERGGELTGQPVGPLVDKATMTTVMSANRVNSGSLSSRWCTFRRTHTVGVPRRALWLVGIFLRRKERFVGVVETRTGWVLKGEGDRMTTPLLQYVARFDGGSEIIGFGLEGY